MEINVMVFNSLKRRRNKERENSTNEKAGM